MATRRAWGLAGVTFAVVACATVPPTEKGARLVPYDISPSTLERAHASRRLALLIGISEYDDSQWKSLRFAAKDARDFGAVLADPARGAYTRVITRTGPNETTREGIRTALAEIQRENSADDDIVIVYVSGHGTLARDAAGELRRYLVTRDTRMGDISGTALSIDELKSGIDRLPSHKKALVLATCHSGAGKSLLPADVQKDLEGIKSGFFVRPIEETSRASFVLAACDWGETAREDEGLQNDIYTHFLIQAIAEGIDRNGDGAITATEAHDFARRMTFEFTHGRQRPSAETVEVGADPVVLSGSFSRRGNPELYSYASALDGFTLRVDGAPLADLPGGVSVLPGAHRMQIQKGGGPALYDGDVSLSVGQRVAVEDLITSAAPRFTLFARGGYQGIYDSSHTVGASNPTPAFGLSLWLRDVPSARLSLEFDVSYGGGRSKVAAAGASTAPVPFTLSVVEMGAALPYSASLGPLRVSIGPRVAGVYLSRSFRQPAYTANQNAFAFTPGLIFGLTYPISERFEVALMTHASFVYVNVDNTGRSLGLGDAWLSLGYRF